MYKIEYSIEDVINNHYKYEDTKPKLIKSIEEKFRYFVDKAQSFVVEDYIENEWRDSHNLYYSRSSYKCENTVKRVHFVIDKINDFKKIMEDNYLGYINLRPIPPLSAVLSRIRFKCSGDAFDLAGAKSFYCLSVYSTVNFPHLSIKYHSFPLYSQDSMVAVCAHADLLMVSKYMYKKFNFNNYTLKDIVNNDNTVANSFGRRIPSEGLNIHQIVDLLRRNNYNPIAPLFRKGMYDEIDIIDYLDSFIESALPVIAAFNGHVMVFIGHVHTDEKYYIIADDSTHHLTNSFGTRKAHVETVSEAKLKDVFSKTEVYLITPSFDRLYLHFPYLNLILKETKKLLIDKVFESNENIKLITREVLVESATIKQFLNTCGDNSFESVEMPHYVWYIEFYLDSKELKNLVFYMLIDASAHKLDRTYSIILNTNNHFVSIARDSMKTEVKQLSLLTSI
ncbi:hypothetical protein [Sulfurimonas sp.]